MQVCQRILLVDVVASFIFNTSPGSLQNYLLPGGPWAAGLDFNHETGHIFWVGAWAS